MQRLVQHHLNGTMPTGHVHRRAERGAGGPLRLGVCGGPRCAGAGDRAGVAGAVPGVIERGGEGLGVRVDGRGVGWSYPERQPGRPRVVRTDIAVLYVGDEAEKQALLKGEPDVFFTAPGYDGWPLVLLRLECVQAERLEELVADAWRMRGGSAL